MRQILRCRIRRRKLAFFVLISKCVAYRNGIIPSYELKGLLLNMLID